MPRVYTVKKARASKKTRRCRTCGTDVQVGETYRYFEPRHGPPVIYCKDHYPKRGDMTTSKLGSLYNAQDDCDLAACISLEDLESTLQTVADTAREVAEEYEESISNMPEGLQEGPVAEEMREKIDALETYADELEGFEPSCDEDESNEENLGTAREEAQQALDSFEY